MSWRARVITLFPEAFPGLLGLSVIGRGLALGHWALDAVDLRQFGEGPHRKVDDTPAGGGPGMVLRCDVLAAAIDAQPRDELPWIVPSPRGQPLTQAMVRAWANGPGLNIVCGRFEGLDQRAIDKRGLREIAVGDAVLAGGEVAAMLILEACVRLLPGVLHNPDSPSEESFSDNLLEYPQYTRPVEFEGARIPDVLLQGHHAQIKAWRRAQSEALTRARRPDLGPPDLGPMHKDKT